MHSETPLLEIRQSKVEFPKKNEIGQHHWLKIGSREIYTWFLNAINEYIQSARYISLLKSIQISMIHIFQTYEIETFNGMEPNATNRLATSRNTQDGALKQLIPC